MWIFPWLIKLAIIYMMNRLVVLSTRCKTNVKNSQRPDNYPTCISCNIREEGGAKSSYLRSWKQKILTLARKNDLTFDESLQLCVTVTPERCKINKYLYLIPAPHFPTMRPHYDCFTHDSLTADTAWHVISLHLQHHHKLLTSVPTFSSSKETYCFLFQQHISPCNTNVLVFILVSVQQTTQAGSGRASATCRPGLPLHLSAGNLIS